MTLRVQDQSPEVAAMAMDWAVCEALMGGTRAMRDAGEEFLPRWPAEDVQSHAARLKVATLFPAYRRTVGVMSGKPFSKALTLGDDVPARIQQLCEDIDLQGRNLHAFAADAFQKALAYGFGGILVDFPKASGVRTLADEKRAGVRPYFVHIKHSQILGWKAELIGGAMRITQLRLAETHERQDGAYGVECVKRVRVLEPGRYQVWQEPDKAVTKSDDYVLIEEGTTSLPVIPFVPLYGYREAFMCGKPPLMDLAWLNVKHWQSQSDQDNITHVARVPILVATGIDDVKWQLAVGAGTAVNLPTGATLGYAEHSGAAIGAGRTELQDLEAQMIQTGAELLVKKPGDRSATEAANDADGNKSDLQRIAETFSDALDYALQLMAQWIGEKEGGHVSLFSDYGASSLGQASGQLVLAMQQGGLISKPTAIREMQRRGELDAGLDPDEVLAEVETEGPALGDMADPLADPTADHEDAPPTAPGKPPGAAKPARAEDPEDPAEPMDPAEPPEPEEPKPAPFDVAAFADALTSALTAALSRIQAPVVNIPEQPAPVVNLPAITVEGSTFNLNQPEQAAPVVNVAAPDITVNPPAVTVEPAAVTVNVPEQAAPAVNVAAPIVNVEPPSVNVTVERAGSIKFTEDASGNITGAQVE